jgi:hypothetical protein
VPENRNRSISVFYARRKLVAIEVRQTTLAT